MGVNGYDFYLGKQLLPVTPDKLQIKVKNKNETLTLINEGEVNILKNAGLTEIEFECLLPNAKYPFARYKDMSFKGAGHFIDFLGKLKTGKKPFQFIVSRVLPNGTPLFSSNIKVALEDYTIEESAKEGADVSVKIKLKGWREYGTKKITINEKAVSGTTSSERAVSTVAGDKAIVIGSDVTVNGRLYGSSTGDAPGKTLVNYKGKINFINLRGGFPYHVTTPTGGWLGWVEKGAVQKI